MSNLVAVLFGRGSSQTSLTAACEILDDGRAGMLLNEATPESIANAVSEMENRPVETKHSSCHGLRLAGDRYALGASVEQLAEMLGAVAAKNL